VPDVWIADQQERADSPVVSVLVAVYNDERRLGRCLDSILAQTFPAWEAIVVDDGSTDSTLAIARAYSERDPRIRVIQVTHRGPGAARNAGLAEARGEWIAILDSDDRAVPERLAIQLAFSGLHPEVGCTGGAATRISTRGQPWGTWRPGPRSVDAFRAMRTAGSLIYFVHSTIMVRRGLMLKAGGYPEDYPTGEDTAFYNLRLSPLTDMVALPDTLAWHEMNPYSLSRREARREVGDLEVIRLNLARRRAGMMELSWEQSVRSIVSARSWRARFVARRTAAARSWRLKGAALLAAGSPDGAIWLFGAAIVAPDTFLAYAVRLLRSLMPLVLGAGGRASRR